jgi:acetyl esterase/lipase
VKGPDPGVKNYAVFACPSGTSSGLPTILYPVVTQAQGKAERREGARPMNETTRAVPATEPLVMELWPGAVPGDVGIDGQQSSRIYNSKLVGNTRLITNVTRPSLTVYRPPAAQNTGAAMLVCPGGGYHDLFWDLEGEEVAAWLNSQGMTGIILKYRCPRRPGDVKGVPPLGPQLDAQRAVSMVRSKAKEWGIDPRRIGMVGFSAGGHLALATATGFHERRYTAIDAIDAVSCRPDFAVLCYSGYLKADGRDEISPRISIPADTPPIFLAHSSDDSISEVAHSVIMYLALQRAKIPAELHVYATGEHDFGVRRSDQLPASWTDLCLAWLRSRGLLAKAAERRRS